MATMQSSCEAEYFRVIHPLDDAPEQKCVSEGLGQIAMTSSVRLSLKILRLSGPDERDAAISRAGSGWHFHELK